ncbi:MAG: DUF881 domain-containing protein [Anaerolineae bacterium]|nr:DUF881 domain-containing protein [Anaerolineae bacterium]
MLTHKWMVHLSLTAVCLVLGLMSAVQLRSRQSIQPILVEGWDYAVADLIDSNARLRSEIESLEQELEELRQEESSAAMLQSLVDDTNRLRIANGLVAVSGPGVEVVATGPISILDLHDMINELRNAGAEALALNGQRLASWSAISNDGVYVTIDGQPTTSPYRLEAIGDAGNLETALLRPGGLVSLVQQADPRIAIEVEIREKVTLPVYQQPLEFVYARPVE